MNLSKQGGAGLGKARPVQEAVESIVGAACCLEEVVVVAVEVSSTNCFTLTLRRPACRCAASGDESYYHSAP